MVIGKGRRNRAVLRLAQDRRSCSAAQEEAHAIAARNRPQGPQAAIVIVEPEFDTSTVPAFGKLDSKRTKPIKALVLQHGKRTLGIGTNEGVAWLAGVGRNFKRVLNEYGNQGRNRSSCHRR